MSKYLRVTAALAAAVVVTGCGGGSGTSSKPPTKAAADQAATAINLTVADLPSGYTAAPHDASSDSSPEDAAFAACVGATAPNVDDITDAFSEDFNKGAQIDTKQVSSEVEVVKSASTAASDLKAFKGDKAKTCIETFVTKLLAKEAGSSSGVSFGTPTVARIDITSDGLDGAFGYQVRLTVTAQGQQIPFDVTIAGLLKDHTEVSLTTLSIGQPFPTSDRDALLQKLRDRAKKSAV